MQRWLWGLVLGVSLWSSATFILDEQWVVGLAVLVIGGLLAWRVSPWQGGRTLTHAQVEAMEPQERPVVIYWRPGCQFCARLKRGLGKARAEAHWVNIWQDPQAAEFVRSVNDGNETVPTVVLAGRALTNPDADVVLAQLSS